MKSVEVNFDGLVGPNHNYAGLSYGNIASKKNIQAKSNPKAAALQGLEKMKALADMGLVQGVLPPHERPAVSTLRALGYSGSDRDVIQKAWRENPAITAACFSASPMWTANAATVSPWADTADGRTHFTPANLSSMFHRSYESDFTGRVLKTIFSDEASFCHHAALPSGLYFGDEGAANHTRLCSSHDHSGVEMFVFGDHKFQPNQPKPKKYPARQSYEASQAVARQHGLDLSKVVFAQQNPDVIDQGVFHNDVIAVGNTSLLFFHEQAFLNSADVVREVKEKMLDQTMHFVEVKTEQVSVQAAVSSYLFNTQLINTSAAGEPDSFTIIAPTECQETPEVYRYLNALQQSDSPINDIRYFDLRQSMRNGGGPACLRLRVAMNERQIDSIKPSVFINDDLYAQLVTWVEKHYRDELHNDDLRDPAIIDEFRTAFDELSRILNLGSIYDFQR